MSIKINKLEIENVKRVKESKSSLPPTGNYSGRKNRARPVYWMLFAGPLVAIGTAPQNHSGKDQ